MTHTSGARSRSVRSAPVDFDLSEDQQALVDAAAALLDQRASMTHVREISKTASRFDRGLWSHMAEQGWLAVERPEHLGGLGMGFVEVAVLCEQLGKHVAPVPFAGTILALGALERASSDTAGGLDAEEVADLNERFAEKLSTAEAVGAMAWSRSPGQVRAERSGSGWVLSGRPDPVVFGPAADIVVVPATVDGDRSALFAVTDIPESARRVEQAMDLSRSLGWLELEETRGVMIGDAGAAAAAGDRAAVAASAEMLGAAQQVLEMTVAYAKDRVQFGRPIGSFQAVKHRCADMLVDLEGMRSVVYYSAWCLAAGSPDSAAAASAAKIWCSDAASRIMGSGLQVHGGIGFTWEHDLHFFVKRSQLDQVSFGESKWHRDRLASLLRPLAEAGQPVM